MAQQINLSSPLLLKEKQYFSAQTMALALLVFLVVGGGGSGFWVWSLDKVSQDYHQTMATQAREITDLQAAIQRLKASAAPPDPALVQQAQALRRQQQQREQMLQALQQGLFRPGEGHSDRLQWVARSIPAPVWITDMQADAGRLQVAGFTLEPAALNAWVDKLSTHPLMRGLQLSTVKVENTSVASVRIPASASTAAAQSRAVWSFQLVSEQPAPAVANVEGSKP